MSEPVIVAVPPKGGSFSDVMKKLVGLDLLDHGLVDAIRRLIKEDKRRIKLEEGLIALWDANGCEAAATTRAADAAGHDLGDIDAALARMRRYTDESGSTRISFTPKSGVDLLLQEYRTSDEKQIRAAAMTLHLELDCTRYGRPSRMMFDHLECELSGHLAVLVGTEHEVTPTYLRKHKRDISLTCYDAFHNTLLDALDTGKVHNWRELNEHLVESNTDVRILGSLGLDDYLGHFVLMPESKAKETAALGDGRAWNVVDADAKLAILRDEPLLIDAGYEEVYKQLLDADANGIRFEATTRDIEMACSQEGRMSVYIVRSGSTIACTPGLCVYGEELITSETIVAVNQERLDHNRAVGELIERLNPIAEDRSDAWRTKLAQKLGDKLF